MRNKRNFPISHQRTLLAAALALITAIGPIATSQARKTEVSPLTDDVQSHLSGITRLLKSGKYDRASSSIQGLLESVNDVPKCIAIASSTEGYGSPMQETRRLCLEKAMSLAGNRDDMILVALKARQYQLFEVTRQAMNSLIQNARTVPELYDLARKAQEAALNDIAHLAMEKAYTGIRDESSADQYADTAKALGMEDLLRKVVKDRIDDEHSVHEICNIILKSEGYNMRDLTRYGLRKAMDNSTTVKDMEDVFETARRLNENDISNRAEYFVRKGKLIQKIKEDRAAYEIQLRAWRQGILLDQAQARDAVRQQMQDASGNPAPPGVTSLSPAPVKRPDPPTSGF